MKLITLLVGILLISGCTSYGVIDNVPQSGVTSEEPYSIFTAERRGTGDMTLILAFSGGGTRAAALAYGVLQELRDTPTLIDGRRRRVLDEIDVISSVSGGSFTSAYYGLHGDRIFEDFEELFLKRNVQRDLLKGLFNPLRWFSSTGRTEMAVQYYEDTLFRGATYADMIGDGNPMILINASDLGYGVRFSFVQEYFDLLCSDLSSFPVARAVAASSAVPILFHPIVVENFADCGVDKPAWLADAEARASEMGRGATKYASVIHRLRRARAAARWRVR